MPLDVSNKPFFVINQNLCQNIPTACGGSLPYAWFARPDVMAYGCLNRMQDCLTKLIYMIEVQVTCENGRAEPVRLKLIIGDDWDHTDVVKVS
ncbi:hypothetical protein [Vulcanisaeta sp. JCM 14467]|uniref:hypothetical protein n=1 Tax=Vulcanisaeta sp. JCM 14467 TaxID=1295370 RepID=UPI0006D29B53|nr:hypothetical protein [Vulcanisaeta sp. JCM 14467]